VIKSKPYREGSGSWLGDRAEHSWRVYGYISLVKAVVCVMGTRPGNGGNGEESGNGGLQYDTTKDVGTRLRAEPFASSLVRGLGLEDMRCHSIYEIHRDIVKLTI